MGPVAGLLGLHHSDWLDAAQHAFGTVDCKISWALACQSKKLGWLLVHIQLNLPMPQDSCCAGASARLDSSRAADSTGSRA